MSTLSAVARVVEDVGRPCTVDGLIGNALEAVATAMKPVKGSFWGYGGVVQAPDGARWTLTDPDGFAWESV